MNSIQTVKEHLVQQRKKWLITGVAGFIGSNLNLLEELPNLDQDVIGLDNFSTGKQENLDEVKAIVGGGKVAEIQLYGS